MARIVDVEMARLDKASDKAPLGRRNYKETMRDLAIDKRRAAMDKGDNSEAVSLMADSINKRKDIAGGGYRRELSTGERESLQNVEDERIGKLEDKAPTTKSEMGKKAGGAVKMAKGGYVRAADGAAQRGRTKGRTL